MITCQTVIARPQRGASTNRLVLEEGHVHAWCVPLGFSVSEAIRCGACLSSDEQGRADRYRVRRAREEYVSARGLLRMLLGRYLSVDPKQIEFDYGLYGKPTIKTPRAGETLHFSVAHSYGLALFAFARSEEVGVDIEKIRPEIEFESLAPRVLTTTERERLGALPEDQRRREFFFYWACKEAYGKARGIGLGVRLDQVAVAFEQGSSVGVITSPSESRTALWSVVRLTPSVEYAGAVVRKGREWQMRFVRAPTRSGDSR